MTLIATPRYRAGTGSPLVLLHAGWMTWRIWTPILGTLSADFDVLAPTLPGHLGGKPIPARADVSIQSFVDELETELDLAGFDRPDIVGNSIGGWAALELARRGRARRVVAIGPMGMQTAKQARALERTFKIQRRAAKAVHASRWARWAMARRLLLRDAAVRADQLPAELAGHLLEAFETCDIPALFDAIRGPDGYMPTIAEPHEITVPVLLIRGARDQIATDDQLRRYATALPNATLLDLPGLSHSPHLDAPGRIASEIRAFCADSTGVATGGQ